MSKVLAVALASIALSAHRPLRVHAGGTTTEKCQAAKLKALGKGVADALACYSKAKAKSTAVDPNCLGKAQQKVDAAITKAGVACGGTTDMSACVTTLSGDCPGDGKCPAASEKATGKGSSSDLGCQAKDVTKPGTFAGCRAKNDSKVGAALLKAGNCASASTVSDIHQCTTDVANIIIPPPTTTSTSTSTSTTITSLPPCGEPSGTECNGACPMGEACVASASPSGCQCTPFGQCAGNLCIGACSNGSCGGPCPAGYSCVDVAPQIVLFCCVINRGCGSDCSCPPGGSCLGP